MRSMSWSLTPSALREQTSHAVLNVEGREMEHSLAYYVERGGVERGFGRGALSSQAHGLAQVLLRLNGALL
ncbi:hypothetical protein AA15669_0485 [Saccharibacter floricola DSM 15669]|uniref:Uncharacterized protein n=1 Tax=Saccharibacter floricola DSM 15669 TaxID=1123227 RepID=A0ABQ0NXP4_9PROT|nr:hypothetical protein AA15669_0485 [Saccharibacter floricola DSM 15669]